MRTQSALFALVSVVCLSTEIWAQAHGGGGRPSTPAGPTGPRLNYPAPPSLPAGNSLSANDEGKIEFRTQTILVQVPVVVSDKNGNHVRGLNKNDLHLFENGKEQTISTFEEMVASNSRLPAVAPQPGEFRNLTLSEQQPRTVTVIALDTVNTPFLDQFVGRRELVKYLANSLDSGQVLALMIITSHGLKIVHGLTGDPEQLLKALKKVSSETPAMQGVDQEVQEDVATGDIPGLATLFSQSTDPTAAVEAFMEHGDAVSAQFQQQNAIETTLNGFRGIAWALSGLPGRKSLIWATGGFPFTILSPASIPGGYLSTLYERTMAALMQAQISVYPVDVRGLDPTPSQQDVSRSRAPTSQQMINRTWLHQSTTDTLDEFAEMTGGKAFYNTNDLASSFKRAAADASSYYLVGYYLDVHNNKAGWRELKVKVDKKDTEVRARKGFFVTNATLRMDLTRSSDMVYALASPIEGTGVPISVKWLGISGDGPTKKAGFVVQLPPDGLSFDPSGQNRLNFEFAVAAYSPNSKNGEPADTKGQSFATALSEAQMATLHTKGVGFSNTLDLAPGQYAVRFVVRDNVTGKIGSVTAPLTVN